MAKENQLTDAQIRKLKHSGSANSDFYLDGRGLYLRVQLSGAKSWVFVYQLNGKRREMGFGSYADYSLADARERRRTVRQLIDDGVDPIAANDAKKAESVAAQENTKTFDECATKYIASHKAGWKNESKSEAQWTNSLKTYATPHIGNKAVRDIGVDDLVKVLEHEDFWYTTTETANRVRNRIEQILDWAKVKGYRNKNDANPAQWKGNLDKLFPKRAKVQKVKHHDSMKHTEVASFFTTLRAMDGISPQALEFAILTVTRSGETRGARPEEFDLKTGIWTIPPERMKAGKEHRIPLSPRAIEIVKLQGNRDGKFLFASQKEGKPMSDATLNAVLKRAGIKKVTTHGFRSSFRTWGSDATVYPRDMLEFALAHQIESKVEEAYNRSDMVEKRRELMADWADYCDGKSNVVPLKRAA